MNESIKKAIETLTGKVTSEADPHKAMQFAQAALNLAHALATVTGSERT